MTRDDLTSFASRYSVILISAGIVLLGAAIGLTITAALATQRPKISSALISEVPFPVYVPLHLPPGFKFVTNSFTVTGQQGTALFEYLAKDDAGDQLTFTEQARPSNLTPKQFNGNQLINIASLAGVPYSSTIGTLANQTNTKVLSIFTNKTWVIVSTQEQIYNQDLQDIAQGSFRY